MPISDNPTLAEVVQIGIDAALSDVHKAGPGVVKSYDPLTNTAFVQPAIKHALYSTSTDERTYEELGEIPFVPVIFPRAGGKTMRLPVNEGDTVLLVYCDTSLAEWRMSGSVSEPEDARRHSIGWPVAIVGFYPDSNPPPAADGAEVAAGAAIFGEEGGANQLLCGGTVNGFRFGATAIDPIALSQPTDQAIAAIVSALNALIVKHNTHVHTSAASGSPTTTPVIGTPALPDLATACSSQPSTASTMVKAL